MLVKGAVNLVPDAYGFRYASVEKAACTECGLCDKVCPVNMSFERDEYLETWWAKAKDEVLLEKSSSGGIFGLIARQVIAEGGAVYGAAFVDGFKRVAHIRVDDEDSLEALLRSKYVQSAIEAEVYRQVRTDLRNGLYVLFAGTACQVAGLRGYLGSLADSARLLCVDVICHGVPSPRLWEEWIRHLTREAGAELHEVNLRNKTTGWLSYSVLYEYGTERDGGLHATITSFRDDWYMKAFLANASLRSSCFRCAAKRSCGSDLTLGDFWGFAERYPEIDCKRGVSAVIVNTEAGKLAFKSIGDKLNSGAADYAVILAGNPSLERSVAPYAHRREFLDEVASGQAIGRLIRKWDFKPALVNRLYSSLSGIKHTILAMAKASK